MNHRHHLQKLEYPLSGIENFNDLRDLVPTPLPPFDFDLLRSFVAIVDHGGFTRAGERVGRTQSTISLQIRKLEKALGHRVFQREPGQEIRLTPEGEILLTYARQILKLGDEARTRLTEPEIEGEVRFGTPEDFATTHLPDILAQFARSYVFRRAILTP